MHQFHRQDQDLAFFSDIVSDWYQKHYTKDIMDYAAIRRES